jgi:hypothetical protein
MHDSHMLYTHVHAHRRPPGHLAPSRPHKTGRNGCEGPAELGMCALCCSLGLDVEVEVQDALDYPRVARLRPGNSVDEVIAVVAETSINKALSR